MNPNERSAQEIYTRILMAERTLILSENYLGVNTNTAHLFTRAVHEAYALLGDTHDPEQIARTDSSMLTCQRVLNNLQPK